MTILQTLNLKETKAADISAVSGVVDIYNVDLFGTSVSDISVFAGKEK